MAKTIARKLGISIKIQKAAPVKAIEENTASASSSNRISGGEYSSNDKDRAYSLLSGLFDVSKGQWDDRFEDMTRLITEKDIQIRTLQAELDRILRRKE